MCLARFASISPSDKGFFLIAGLYYHTLPILSSNLNYFLEYNILFLISVVITICCGFIKSAQIDIGHGYIDNTGFDLSIMDIKKRRYTLPDFRRTRRRAAKPLSGGEKADEHRLTKR